MTTIKVYGVDWCPHTQRTLEQLQTLGVPYEYIDLQRDAAARDWVKMQNGGKEKKPTLEIGGRILSEPTEIELEDALARRGLL